jgi:hypothetical protein
MDIHCYGGSNVSENDAMQKAVHKADLVQRKINGDRSAFQEYEIVIREEILEELREGAVITRNRYGARVLNVEKLLILDIDKPKSAFGDIFKKKDLNGDKAKIFDMVRKLAAGPRYQGLGFRLYETAKGARVIVTGRDFDARNADTVAIMKDFNCDALYVSMCIKQECFRARLTPKPGRIKMGYHKVRFPRENDPALDQWIRDYEHASRDFSVCRLVEQIGGGGTSDLIQVHDEYSGVYTRLPLA